MQFSCTQENLKTALILVSHIAARQGSLPILSNVLLRAETKALTLTATNLEIAMTYALRGRVDGDGAFTVHAKLLSDVISLFPRDRVDAVVDRGELALTSRGSATKVRGMDAAEFPLIPIIERVQEVVVHAGALRDALAQAAFAVAAGSARPELCGVYVAFESTSMKIVATDSYRLAEVTLPITKSAVPKGTNVIIPGRTVQELLRVLGVLAGDADAADVALAFTPNQLLATIGNLSITSRLVDGTYPDYTQIIPRHTTTRAVLPRAELLTCVRAASLFARTGINDIHLRMVPKGNQCIVRSENAQLGEHHATIDATSVTGDEVTTVLNARYLLEGLTAITGDAVALELTGAVAPVVLKPAEGEGYVYIIMPIKQ